MLIGIGVFILAYEICESFISYKTAIFGFPLISLAYGLMVISAISPTSILFRFKSKISLIIATLSYSIYLTHKQLYHLVKLWTEKSGIESLEQWIFWICVTVAIIGGFALHLIIEKPFLKIRDKILTRN